MTPAELKDARATLGLSQKSMATVLHVDTRTYRGWEAGSRKGKPARVPENAATLVRMALASAKVRRELGLARKSN